MIQKLPLELVTLIASYLDFKSISEFATTCRNSYFAVLPLIWHHLTITDTKELYIITKRLQVNTIWSQRAIQFVRQVSLCNKNQQKKFSCSLAASMFGITSTPSEQQDEKIKELQNTRPHEQIGSFGHHLLDLFPHINSLVFDYAVALKNFYLVQQDFTRLPYSGSLSLINFESDNAGILHNLLMPFKKISHLKLQTVPVVSLCDDIDESILTNADIIELSNLGFNNLTKLELSNLDSSIELNVFTKLLQSLPRLSYLQLEWIFTPLKDDYEKLCQIIEHYASLYPTNIQKNSNILGVTFTYKDSVLE